MENSSKKPSKLKEEGSPVQLIEQRNHFVEDDHGSSEQKNCTTDADGIRALYGDETPLHPEEKLFLEVFFRSKRKSSKVIDENQIAPASTSPPTSLGTDEDLSNIFVNLILDDPPTTSTASSTSNDFNPDSAADELMETVGVDDMQSPVVPC